MINVVRMVTVEFSEQQVANLEEFLDRVEYKGTIEAIAVTGILQQIGKGLKKRQEKDIEDKNKQ